MEILDGAASGQAGENVIGAEKQVVILQPCEQRFKIVTAALEFDVIPLGDVVNAHVELVAARKDAGDLFAEEKIGAGAQVPHPVSGIVLRDRHAIHAGALELLVAFLRLVVALLTSLSRSLGMAPDRVACLVEPLTI